MTTPLRILRAKARNADPEYYVQTERQQRREASILRIATHLIADEGLLNVTFNSLAVILHVTRSTLSFHFLDIEALVGEIILRHQTALLAELLKFPAADLPARRAAYLRFTRTPGGALTESHLIAVRDLSQLPPDLLEPLCQNRRAIAEMVGGFLADEATLLLDSPALDLPQIEARLRPQPAETTQTKTTTPETTAAQSAASPTGSIPAAPRPIPPTRPQFARKTTAFPTPPFLSTTENGEIPGAWINDLIAARPAPA